MTAQRKIFYSLLLAVLVLAPLGLNLTKLANFCYNGYDLGLYHEVVTDLSVPGNLNPWLSVRGIKAFNDHSNPIFIPLSVGIKMLDVLLTGNPGNPLAMRAVEPSTSLVFEWLAWVAAGLIFFYLLRDRPALERWTGVLMFFALKGPILGLYYPIHADFMLTGAWIVFTWSLLRRRRTLFLLSLTLIALSKESYPIAFLFTGAMLFLVDRRWAWPTLAIAGLMTLWNQVGRTIFLGPVHGFAERMIFAIVHEPVAFFLDWWKRVPFASILEMYAFSFVAIYLLWRRDRRSGWTLAATMTPLFGLHALAGLLENHYAFWLPSTGLAAFFFSGAAGELLARPLWHRAIVGLTVLSGLGVHVNGSRFLWVTDTNCQVSAEYRAEFREARRRLDELPENAVVGATGGIVPNLVAPTRDLRHLHSHSIVPETFDALAFEVGPAAFDYPLNPDKTRAIMKLCEAYAAERLFEGKHLVVWKGVFPKSCVYREEGDQKGL